VRVRSAILIAALLCLTLVACAWTKGTAERGTASPASSEEPYGTVLFSKATGRIISIYQIAGNTKNIFALAPMRMFISLDNPAEVSLLRKLIRAHQTISSMTIDDYTDNMHYKLSGVTFRGFSAPDGISVNVAHFSLHCGPPTCTQTPR
jgi:hypothetical protein